MRVQLPPVTRHAWVLSLVVVSLISTAPLASQSAPSVEALRAFARLYGYVRYFHPSDAAAAVPWEAFVVHGVGQVKTARTPGELRRALEALFRPIAPSVQVFPTAGPAPAPVIRARRDTAGHPTVAWQHLGLGLAVQTPYRSIRVNRANPVPGGSAFGTVIGSVDATPYAGATVRLRGFVRAEVTGSGNQGQLWLRVDRSGGQRGFFDNMEDRPITAAEWRPYEIVGEVAADAAHIVFGCFLYGRGTVWLDDLELSVRNADGGWTPIPVQNAGFEDVDDAGKPRGWFAATPGYAFTVVDEGAHRGRRALTISDATTSTAPPLFAGVPQVGEAVVKELGAGLSARIPLALYGDDSTAHGARSAPSFLTLRQTLRGVGLDTLTADDESVRLADVIIAWNVFRHFYPYLDVVPGDWDAALTTALAGALADRTAGEFLHTLNRLVAALHDGHARVVPRQPPNATLPVYFEWIEDQVVVTWAADTALRPGDVVVAIDGAEVGALVEAREREISGSPQWKRYRSMRELCVGDDDTEVALRVRRDGRVFGVTLARSRQADRPDRGDSVRLLGDEIWYVDLDRAEMPAIAAHMDELARARGVIFDLRGYPRGNHAVLSHLLSGPDTSGAWMQIPQTVYPDQERPVGTTRNGWRLQPAQPHIAGKVVFITDGRAISYAESFMSFVEHYRLGEIMGQATAGTNGNVNVLVLPGGYRIPWTGMRVLKHDGSRHHLVGVRPTIPASRTIAGVREGRDELLERALAVIRGEPRP